MVGGQQNKKMKKILIFNIVFIFVIIIFLEFIVKYFELSNLKGIEKGLINTDNQIHKMIPGASGILYDKKVFIDENGFRVPSKFFSYSKENNSIFIIGDSTTFGNGVKEENTFVGQLRTNFENLNFLNSSVPGYNLRHYKHNFKIINDFDNIIKIIYFITLNDIYEKKSVKEFNNKKKFFFNIDLVNNLNIFFRNKSYLFTYFVGITTDPSKRYFQNVLNFYKNKDISKLDNYLRMLKTLSLKKNIDLEIIILPYEYQTRKCTNDDLIPQKKIKNILQNLAIDFLDYTDYFCNFNKPKTLFYKFDPMHLSREGHSLVYNLLKGKI